jgi:hypothetical protein
VDFNLRKRDLDELGDAATVFVTGHPVDLVHQQNLEQKKGF